MQPVQYCARVTVLVGKPHKTQRGAPVRPQVALPQQHRARYVTSVDYLRLGTAALGPFEETQRARQAQHMPHSLAPIFAVPSLKQLPFLMRKLRELRKFISGICR